MYIDAAKQRSAMVDDESPTYLVCVSCEREKGDAFSVLFFEYKEGQWSGGARAATEGHKDYEDNSNNDNDNNNNNDDDDMEDNRHRAGERPMRMHE